MIIRTLLFYILLAIWTIFMGIICLPYLIFPATLMRLPVKIWIGGIFILLKKISGVSYEIIGIENIPEEPVIVVSKHQSAFETFALFYYIKNSFFIHKKQLFYIPIFGQYLLKFNMIAIERESKASAMRKILNDVKEKIDKGLSIIIFPEGTRKLPKEKPDYKSGFFGIYKITKRKLLPVALNSGLCWPKHSWLIKKGNITIKILKTIQPNLEKNAVMKLVEKKIEEATNELLI